jgi:hypothetical protein
VELKSFTLRRKRQVPNLEYSLIGKSVK